MACEQNSFIGVYVASATSVACAVFLDVSQPPWGLGALTTRIPVPDRSLSINARTFEPRREEKHDEGSTCTEQKLRCNSKALVRDLEKDR